MCLQAALPEDRKEKCSLLRGQENGTDCLHTQACECSQQSRKLAQPSTSEARCTAQQDGTTCTKSSTIVTKAIPRQQQHFFFFSRTCQCTDQEVGCRKELLVADGILQTWTPTLHAAPHQSQEGCEDLLLQGLQLPQYRQWG